MNNEINEIRQLLNRYYEGDTTQEEESKLTDFFATSECVPEDLATEKVLFLNLQKVSGTILPSDDFEDRLLKAIENRDCQETPMARERFPQWRKMAVAACLLTMFGIGMFFLVEENRNSYEITDDKLAYAKTEEALLLVSEKLNKVDIELNKMNYTLNKLKNMNKNEN